MSARPARAPTTRKKASRTHLNVVRRRKKGLLLRSGSRRVAPMLVGVALVVISTISIVLMEQVMLAQTAFKVSQMREEMVKAEARQAELTLLAARLGSSERIERVAKEDLGMVSPEEVHYVVANVKPKAPVLADSGRRRMVPTDDHAAALERTTP